MGVRPQIGVLLQAPAQTKSTCPSPWFGHGQTVHHIIRQLIKPAAFFYVAVRGVRPRPETKGRRHPRAVHTHIQMPLLYILQQNRARRIAVNPLIGIAVLRHKSAGLGVKLQQLRPKKGAGFLYLHSYSINKKRPVRQVTCGNKSGK